MNSHLNLFKSYSREDREYQLENDLTRAFAICLQEDNLFLHEILKTILSRNQEIFNRIFKGYQVAKGITIDIQKNVKNLDEFDHLFAVSLSEYPMDPNQFFDQQNDRIFEPISDLVILIEDLVIIFEVKPNNTDCTAQLYNQAFNASETISPANVTPVDLNWKSLMELVLLIDNFEILIEKPSRFLKDFVELINRHNYRWLPQFPISGLNSKLDNHRIYDRLSTALANSIKYEPLDNRLGFKIDQPWAEEMILDVKDSKISVAIYPGNTKAQGSHLFKSGKKSVFTDEIIVGGKTYILYQGFHVKLTSFQKYFAGLFGNYDEVQVGKDLLSYDNYRKFSGRKKRGDDWNAVESFFDDHFVENYNWRKQLKWEEIFDSGKNQFDISIGYELYIEIPITDLKIIDIDKDNLAPLITYLEQIKECFEKIVK